MELWSRCFDGCVCNLKSLMLRIKNCDDLVKNLNTLMCIDIGTIAVLFNINTDNEITLVKLLESY